MAKRFYLILFIAIFAFPAFSQSQFFQRPLDPGRLSPGNDVISTGRDEYLFSSMFFPGGALMNAGDFNFTRLNPSGNIQWSNDFSYPFPLVSGDLENWQAWQAYLFAGFYFDGDSLPGAMLTRLSQDGTALWAKSFSLNGSVEPANGGKATVLPLEDKNALLGAGPAAFVSADEANDLSLLKVGHLGELLWGREYCFSCVSGAVLTYGNTAAVADSGYVVCGSIRYEGPGGTKNDVFLMKVDTGGVFQWAKSYAFPDSLSAEVLTNGLEVTVLANGHFVVAGTYEYSTFGGPLTDGLILETDGGGVPVKALRVNLNSSRHHVFLNHLAAIDSINTLVIPGSSVQDTLPSAGVEHNFLFQIQLGSGAVDWAVNYFSEIVDVQTTVANGFSWIQGGFAYLPNFAAGTDTYYPYLVVADLDGRTACQTPIELAVQEADTILTTDFIPEVITLEDTTDFTPTILPFDEYSIDVPILDLGESEFFCDPTFKTLDATVPGAESYLWSTGATTAQIIAQVPGTYFVEDTSHVQCWILRDTISLQILPPPEISIGVDTTGFCEFGEITLVAGAYAAESLSWSTGATTNTIIVTTPGTYSVTGVNMCGTTTATIELTLPDCTGQPDSCSLEVPSAFTPDNDGVNDRFIPLSDCEIWAEFHLRVYSRWGQLVFDSTDPTKGWDGNYKAKPMPSDVFGWILEYRFPKEDEVKLKKGEVTLLR